MKILELSHSSIVNGYLFCRRFYYLDQIKQIVPRKTAIPLVVGRAFHSFVQAFYSKKSPDECLEQLKNEFERVGKESAALLSKEEVVRMHIEFGRTIAMAMAYTEAHKDDFLQYKEFITEQRVQIPLVEGAIYKGYIDCLMQDAAGDWWIKETKTAKKGSISADYYTRVAIDWQVAGYKALCEDGLGISPRGVLYDVVLKTSHSQRQTETITAFAERLRNLYVNEWRNEGLFERHEVEIPSSSSWRKEASFIAKEIVKAHKRREKSWPKNTEACLGKYGTCRYFPICTTGSINSLLFKKKEYDKRK